MYVILRLQCFNRVLLTVNVSQLNLHLSLTPRHAVTVVPPTQLMAVLYHVNIICRLFSCQEGLRDVHHYLYLVNISFRNLDGIRLLNSLKNVDSQQVLSLTHPELHEYLTQHQNVAAVQKVTAQI